MPTPGSGELLLRVDACAICRTDLHVVEGELPVRRSPLIPGHQIVGRVTAMGSHVDEFKIGDRIGVAWLNRTCGKCEYCLASCENLRDQQLFTGWNVDGGSAEHAVAPASFTYHIPENFEDVQAAPLLCAGIIGYRFLHITGLKENEWKGARFGLFGFGAAGHISIQLARSRGAEVYVCTRDRERHQALAHELGATWVGDAADEPPVKLDAAIIFAPPANLCPSRSRQ